MVDPLYQWRKQCGRKRKHWRRRTAREHKKRLEAKDGQQVAIYRCKYCGALHVGRTGRMVTGWSMSRSR
jgi:rubrerythrin